MSTQKKQNNTMNQTKLNANGHANASGHANQMQVIPVSAKRGKTDRSVISSILHLIGSIDDMNRSHETITERSEVKNNYGLLSTLG